MGVAHARDGELDPLACAVDRIDPGLALLAAFESVGDERNGLGGEARLAHVGDHAAVGFAAHADAPLHGLERNGFARGVAALEREAADAARAVAALLDLAAVAVEDPVAQRLARSVGGIEEQELVGADSEAPVGETADEIGRERDGLGDGVKDDEVVPRALHLGE